MYRMLCTVLDFPWLNILLVAFFAALFIVRPSGVWADIALVMVIFNSGTLFLFLLVKCVSVLVSKVSIPLVQRVIRTMQVLHIRYPAFLWLNIGTLPLAAFLFVAFVIRGDYAWTEVAIYMPAFPAGAVLFYAMKGLITRVSTRSRWGSFLLEGFRGEGRFVWPHLLPLLASVVAALVLDALPDRFLPKPLAWLPMTPLAAILAGLLDWGEMANRERPRQQRG